jgi:hypothetical protein
MTDNDYAQPAEYQQTQRIAAIRSQLADAGFAVTDIEYLRHRYVVYLATCWKTEKAIRDHLDGTGLDLRVWGTDIKRGPYIVVKVGKK